MAIQLELYEMRQRNEKHMRPRCPSIQMSFNSGGRIATLIIAALHLIFSACTARSIPRDNVQSDADTSPSDNDTQIQGTAYYIDAAAGDDTFSGLLPESNKALSDGPWRSFARLAEQTLAPGDMVHLRCGSVFHEQLNVESSGTETAPIIFLGYGPGCATTPPLIDATHEISDWKKFEGAVYVADVTLNRAQINRVKTGRFDYDNKQFGWRSWSEDDTHAFIWRADCNGSGGCLRLVAGSEVPALFHATPINIQEGVQYLLQFNFSSVSSEQPFDVLVRRAGPSYETVGFQQSFVATPTWQSHQSKFVGGASVTGRLDFSIPASGEVRIDNVRLIRLTQEPQGIQQVFSNGVALPLAQHPNPGHLASEPTSPYFRIAEDSALVEGSKGSDIFIVGADFDLSLTRSNDLPGAGVHTRSNNWLIDDRIVTSFDVGGGTLQLNTPSTYGLQKGWGYYFDNKLWMLDRPGEWFYDETLRRLYVWMPDNNAPGTRIRVGHFYNGIVATSTAYLRFENIAIRGANVGVELSGSAYVTLRGVMVSDSYSDGIRFTDGIAGEVYGAVVERSGRNGVNAMRAVSMQVRNTTVKQTGILPVGAPKRSIGAIRCGANAVVSNNHVIDSGYNGIMLGRSPNGVVERNLVERSCLLLDDCGAIYLAGDENNGRVTENIVLGAYGDADGRPVGRPASAKGIYLDEFSEGIVVEGNTVADTDFGIHLHNARSNILRQNTVYDIRKYLIWMQESRLGYEGAIHDNVVEGNRLVGFTGTAQIRMNSVYNWTNFSTFKNNRYALLFGRDVTVQSYKPTPTTGSQTIYDFAEWRLEYEPTASAFDVFCLKGEGRDGTEIILNTTSVPRDFSCAEVGIAMTDCGSYLDFRSASAVTWPIEVLPMSSRVLVAANAKGRDSNCDGVAD